jgi:LmbE family N-acetylglucosaminyl deacetylase
MPTTALPTWRRVLVVVAHPDDESFGLGGVIDAFIRNRAVVDVLCFTQGEASTLGASADLARTRAEELRAAAQELGARSALLRHHPDGSLAQVPPAVLDDDVRDTAWLAGSDGLLVFDPSGITGHPDHQAATASAVRAGASLGLPVLAWTLDAAVARALNAETGAPFHGHEDEELDLRVEVDRTSQRSAISCHASQVVPTSVLWRRLELQGDWESLRWLSRPAPPGAGE